MRRLNARVEQGDGVAVVGPQRVEAGQQRKGLVDGQVQQPLLADQLLCFVACELEEEVPEGPEGESGLDVVGAVEAVEAVGPHHSALLPEEFLLSDIVAGEAEVVDDCP